MARRHKQMQLPRSIASLTSTVSPLSHSSTLILGSNSDIRIRHDQVFRSIVTGFPLGHQRQSLLRFLGAMTLLPHCNQPIPYQHPRRHKISIKMHGRQVADCRTTAISGVLHSK